MEALLSERRKTNEARPNVVPTMIGLATATLLLPLALVALYRSLSSVFTN